jgi:transcriptional regulator with XRE-family HTH domain
VSAKDVRGRRYTIGNDGVEFMPGRMRGLGGAIWRARNRQGLTQKALARRMGYKPQSIGQVESASTRPLRRATLERFACGLGMSFEELVAAVPAAMKMLRAVCPVSQFAPSKWVGWTIVSTETLEHRAGVEGWDKRDTRAFSSGRPVAIYNLARPA